MEIPIREHVRFLSAGQFHAQPGFIHQRRLLDNNVLLFCVRGELHIREAQGMYTLRRGDALVLRAETEHVGFAPSQGEPPIYYWTHFVHASPAPGKEALSLPQYVSCHTPEKPMILIGQLMDTSQTPDAHPMACDLFLALLLMELARQSATGTQNSNSLTLHMLEWLRVHIQDQVTLGDLAKHFNYSPEYLSRTFKLRTGMTIKAYLQQRRLEMAKELLSSTSMLVKEIAYAVGYSSEKVFDKVFARSEHMTPTQYRNAFPKPHMNLR